MRKIAVTGATGFIGKHVVKALVSLGDVDVLAAGRDAEKLKSLGVKHVVHDLSTEREDWFERFGKPDTLIHLAWEGLPNYNESFHLERNLAASYKFLSGMLSAGLQRLVVTGTCYEYGLQNGCLDEGSPARPTTSYAMAKDSLRRLLERAREKRAFDFRWARLFFTYGEGQNPDSLIPKLEEAIRAGRDSFDMSGGEQLRDYLPVEELAKLIVIVSLQDKYDGIFNVCSGKPVSVRRLVEERVRALGGKIRLNLGVFPYPAHEPLAYWGDTRKLRMAEAEFARRGA
jgi:nucleoside-diphosphate-sugar epimerase